MIFTVGHSNHSLEHFLQLLAGAEIGAIADVRSKPHSRKNDVAYVFLGRELGGRPDNPALLRCGKPDYDAMSRPDLFHAGIERIIEGAKTHRIALMCAERDPLDCHRFLLIGRHLARAPFRSPISWRAVRWKRRRGPKRAGARAILSMIFSAHDADSLTAGCLAEFILGPRELRGPGGGYDKTANRNPSPIRCAFPAASPPYGRNWDASGRG